jgi:hypothetical protein
VRLRVVITFAVSFVAAAGVRADTSTTPPEDGAGAAANIATSVTQAVTGGVEAAAAGAEEGEGEDPFEWGVLPFVAGSTDYGVLFGAVAVLSAHEEGAYPYLWRGELGLSASVMSGPDGAEFAQHFDSVRWDIPNLAGGTLRLQPQILFQRTVNAGWYGLGNGSNADLPPGVSDPGRRYQYIYMGPEARFNMRLRLSDTLSLMTGMHGRYVMPGIYPGSRLEADRRLVAEGEPLVRGTEDHGLALLAVGLLWDTRDDETVPTLGFFHELSVRGAVGFRESADFGYAGLTAHLRFYLPLANEYLVLGLRVLLDVLFGDPPFYEMGKGGAFFPTELPGGQDGIRGVPAGRYCGDVKLVSSIEFRSMFWSFHLFGTPMRLGAAAFFDWGRIWTADRDGINWDGVGGGLKFGVGGGIHWQWGRSALFRFELAWSPDASDASPSVPLGAYVAFAQAF